MYLCNHISARGKVLGYCAGRLAILGRASQEFVKVIIFFIFCLRVFALLFIFASAFIKIPISMPKGVGAR